MNAPRWNKYRIAAACQLAVTAGTAAACAVIVGWPIARVAWHWSPLAGVAVGVLTVIVAITPLIGLVSMPDDKPEE